ncbi:hypothetical protein AB205_0124380 [Aquarana catesbeiana]|uniref:Uncharacterized protein n=1 Tax=Aquarana catesbeiana TaxID=8400 RepID=A0A2G9QA47_AQUCT|nr:hypothetical protein AB205_0124380 [Aquarana catesbeiana]
MPSAVATTFLVVYTVHNTYSTSKVVITILLVYTVPCTPSALATTFLVVYTAHNTYSTPIVVITLHSVQCSVVLLNKIYSMSRRPHRRGRRSQATKSGQAGSMSTVNSAGHGHDASSASGRVIEPQHAEELVEWITKPSSSSSSSVTQAQSSLPANAAAKAGNSIGSMSTVTPSLAPPSCMEESPELFDHSVVYMLQEDAQRFEGSDDGTQVEEGSNVGLERGGAQEVKKLAVMFPELQHTAKFAPVTRRERMMRSLTLSGCLIEERRRRTSPTRQDALQGAA